MAQTTISGVINGVNVDRMHETIDAINGDSAIAKFQFRAVNRWQDGSQNKTTLMEFYGAGQEHPRRHRFCLEADEPTVLLGQDTAPNPVEYVLTALASCLTTSLVYQAAARGITVEGVESSLEGDLDLRGFLGLSPDVRKGYQHVRVTIKAKADASAETLRELCQYSPVFDIISTPVPVSIAIEKT